MKCSCQAPRNYIFEKHRHPSSKCFWLNDVFSCLQHFDSCRLEGYGCTGVLQDQVLSHSAANTPACCIAYMFSCVVIQGLLGSIHLSLLLCPLLFIFAVPQKPTPRPLCMGLWIASPQLTNLQYMMCSVKSLEGMELWVASPSAHMQW